MLGANIDDGKCYHPQMNDDGEKFFTHFSCNN